MSERHVTVEGISRYLKNSCIRVQTLREVTSTNTYLKKIAAVEDEGLLVVADSQSAGRGRFQRSFLSPYGTGLYMSLLLKPKIKVSEALSITACAAVAVTDALENIAPATKTGIKWVNDIYSGGRKICGILAESAVRSDGSVEYVVLGIGLNLFEPKDGFGELSSVAGAVFPYSDDTSEMKCRAAAEICDRFMELYSRLGEKIFFEKYRERLFILGRHVTVTRGDFRVPAAAVDIDGDFRLLVRYEDGSEEFLSSGEASVSGFNGDTTVPQ